MSSPQKNKNEAIERLKQSGKIDEKTSAEEINKFLSDDNAYVLNQILYNMKEVIVELYAWILIMTYGELDDDTVKKILLLSGMKDLAESPDFKGYI